MRLLLDAHVPNALAEQLRRHGVDTVALATWRGGVYRTVADDRVLALAVQEGRVLVTNDRKTVTPLLRALAEIGYHHQGVIFLGARALRSSGVGGLVRAILRLVAARGEDDWTDRVEYLRPG